MNDFPGAAALVGLLLTLFTVLDLVCVRIGGERIALSWVSLWPRWLPLDMPLSWRRLRAYRSLRQVRCAVCGELLVPNSMWHKGGIATNTVRMEGTSHSTQQDGEFTFSLCYHVECQNSHTERQHIDTCYSAIALGNHRVSYDTFDLRVLLAREMIRMADSDHVLLYAIVAGAPLTNEPGFTPANTSGPSPKA